MEEMAVATCPLMPYLIISNACGGNFPVRKLVSRTIRQVSQVNIINRNQQIREKIPKSGGQQKEYKETPKTGGKEQKKDITKWRQSDPKQGCTIESGEKMTKNKMEMRRN